MDLSALLSISSHCAAGMDSAKAGEGGLLESDVEMVEELVVYRDERAVHPLLRVGIGRRDECRDGGACGLHRGDEVFVINL